MAKAIINKHIDSVESVVLTDLFIQGEENQENRKGEIIICNDPENPTIYIMDTEGNPQKIAGGGSGSSEAYDDTAIWNAVNSLDNTVDALAHADETIQNTIQSNKEELLESIVGLQSVIGEVTDDNTISEMLNSISTAVSENENAINSNKEIIDNYTINDKKISENIVLNSDDLTVSDAYSALTKYNEGIIPGDIITTAISKIEIMLANTTLALTAAINDLEQRVGNPTQYDTDGNVIIPATGLYQKYEELENLIKQ